MDPSFNQWSGGHGYSSNSQPYSTGRGYAVSMPSVVNYAPFPNYFNYPSAHNQWNPPPPNNGMQMVPTSSNNAQSHNPPRNQNGNSNPFVIDRKRTSVAECESGRNVRVKTEATAATAAPNQASDNSDETHVIFAIDFSSSMNVADVKSSDKNGSITRWNAVFKCVESLLDKQLEEQDTVDSNNNASKCLISLLIFNNESRVLIHKMHLIGDGKSVKEALRAAENDNKPKGGTSFSAGFHEASILAEGYDNVLVVFLTDGRPGDLRPHPPVDSSYAMQAT